MPHMHPPAPHLHVPEPLRRVAARFALAGLLNTALGFSVILGLEFGLGFAPAAANLGGFLAGWITSYVLNRRMVFRTTQGHASTAWRYLAVVAAAFAANQAMLRLTPAVLHALGDPLPPVVAALFAQLSGMACYTGLVFVLCRVWVFAHRPAAAPNPR